MWKVVVVICALGNPCTIFEQDPMVYYNDKNECMTNSSSKHSELLDAFVDYGFMVYDSKFTCESLPFNQTKLPN